MLLSFTLLASDKKKDPEEIGNRDVGKGINFYSLEKEIGLGKALAQDVERQGEDRRRSDHRRVCEPRGPEPGAQLRCESSLHHQGDRQRRRECVRAAGGFFFVNSGLILKADTEAELAA